MSESSKSPSRPQQSPKSTADKAAFAAASYVRAEPLSQKGTEALARLESALAPAPLPTEPAPRRRAINVRGW